MKVDDSNNGPKVTSIERSSLTASKVGRTTSSSLSPDVVVSFSSRATQGDLSRLSDVVEENKASSESQVKDVVEASTLALKTVKLFSENSEKALQSHTALSSDSLKLLD
jgi:hypothetical protein